jgi:hypothetical protein
VPWVVKSSPWSADSGAVPAAIVIVPPFVPPVLLPVLLLLPGLPPALDVEELQAATAPTVPQSNKAPSGLRYLFIRFLQPNSLPVLT